MVRGCNVAQSRAQGFAATVLDECSLPVASGPSALAEMVNSVRCGTPWAVALIDAIGRWSLPCEEVDGERLTYLICGEAFDWLTLAERLLRGLDAAVPNAVPGEERRQLLFHGQLPADVTPGHFRESLGVDKYRAHLNFFYGVVVEEALWHAVEREVAKERSVRGLHHPYGVTDLAFDKLYRADMKTLMRRFRKERDERLTVKFTLTEWKEFTYWLFRLRVGEHDSARIASDTRKGLRMLEEIWQVPPHAQGGLGYLPSDPAGRPENAPRGRWGASGSGLTILSRPS